jgi:tetrahydromethanopterin:alpha-L-glutamate ligase
MAPSAPLNPAIVLFGDGRDWHGRSLLRAFKRRGIKPLVAPLATCGFSTETATGLAIPGLGDHRPEAAFVRFVPGGSFEQVTTYLGVLHALRELGVTVWNDARAIERCVDKSTTTFFLQRAGLPTPRTFTSVRRSGAEEIVRKAYAEGHKLVQKPLFGAQGKGLRLIAEIDDLSPPDEVNGVYHLQEFVPPAHAQHQDWRIFICAGPTGSPISSKAHAPRRPSPARSSATSPCGPRLRSAPTMPGSTSSRPRTAASWCSR